MQVILTIVFSPWSPYRGGAQQSTHNIATILARRGHDVTVVYTKPPWEEIPVPEELPYRLEWANLYATRSKCRAHLRDLVVFSVRNKVGKLIDPDQPTIVHSNGEEGGLIHQLKKDHDFKFVFTPRFAYYPESFYRDPVPLHKRVWHWINERKTIMQLNAVFNADVISPPSRWAAEQHKRFGLPDERFQIVHNGVPREFLNYNRNADRAPRGPIVFFGRFTPEKGIDTLIEAIDLLKQKRDNLPPVLVVGQGREKENYKKEIRQRGLQNDIAFKPWMTHDELGKLLTTTRMTVLPSKEENFSLGILGSMCVGVPTISTQVGGTPEIIDSGENGLLVPPSDPKRLSEAIATMLNQPDFAEKLGRSGAEHIRSELTWERSVDHFEEMYEALVNGKVGAVSGA